MSVRHSSRYCDNCDANTLHIQDVSDPPHLLYFFLSFFTCGFFLVLWILHVLFKSKSRWMCQDCGHVPGTVSDRQREEAFAAREERRLEREEAAEIQAEKKAERAQQKAERKARQESERNSPGAIQAREAAAQKRREAMATAKANAVQQITASVRMVDGGLGYMAGDDSFLHNIYRGLALLAGAGIALGIFSVAWSVVSG